MTPMSRITPTKFLELPLYVGQTEYIPTATLPTAAVTTRVVSPALSGGSGRPPVNQC